MYLRNRRTELVAEEPAPASALMAGFDEANQIGRIGRHRILAAWIEDETSRTHDVVRINGFVPAHIQSSHDLFRRRVRHRVAPAPANGQLKDMRSGPDT